MLYGRRGNVGSGAKTTSMTAMIAHQSIAPLGSIKTLKALPACFSAPALGAALRAQCVLPGATASSLATGAATLISDDLGFRRP